MNAKIKLNSYLNQLIAAVWIVNGVWCKCLNMVPRHQQIVARILGDDYSAILTPLIGFGEILIGMWILTKLYPKLIATIQIVLVTAMNLIELVLASDLLLWGRLNFCFALLFILAVFYNAFCLIRKPEPSEI